MAHDIKGDLRVRRTAVVDRRSDEGMSSETLSGARVVVRHDYKYLNLDPNGANRNVDLPDATTLPLGWEILVRHSGSANSLVVRDGAVSPGTLKTIAVPVATSESRFYSFLLVDNGTAAGSWQIVELGDPSRSTVTFLSGTWSAPSGGYRILSGTEASGLLAANHGKGTNPIVVVQEDVGGSIHEHVTVDRLRINSSGDIELRITDGAEFGGRVIIQ